MKKVIKINIGEMVFAIETDAYEALQNYLEEIKDYFENDLEQQNIIEDIESSVAEKFNAKKRSNLKAVTKTDIEEIIQDLGTIEDFSEEVEVMDDVHGPQGAAMKGAAVKRLYRDPNDVIVGGVAAGIASYFGIDPVITRVAFVLLALWGGFGIVAYLVLLIAIPKAKTATQRLEMKGERATLSSLKKHLETTSTKSILRTINMKTKNFPAWLKSAFSFLTKVLKNIVAVVKRLLLTVLPVVRIIVGAAFMLISSVILFVSSTALLLMLIGKVSVTADPEIIQALQLLMQEKQKFILLFVSLYTLVFVPAFFLFLGGIGLCFKKKIINAWFFSLLVFVWIGALSYSIIVIVSNLGEIQMFNAKVEQLLDDRNYRIYREYLDQEKLEIPTEVIELEIKRQAEKIDLN